MLLCVLLPALLLLLGAALLGFLAIVMLPPLPLVVTFFALAPAKLLTYASRKCELASLSQKALLASLFQQTDKHAARNSRMLKHSASIILL